ncbi:hypothetical protein [Saccharopolyspora sp. 5N708]|uniref:hypothetical protein n=1 Tax=Saccharopolyspora sp. 5N708 TaxID=3457424 RepID=UPI003FD3E3E1
MAAPAHVPDVFDPRRYADCVPHEDFAWLRRHAPVSRHREHQIGDWPPGPGSWAVTRYSDVVAVLKSAEIYSSWWAQPHRPVLSFRRTASTELRGRHISAAGDKIVVFHCSANIDERQFPEPHRFDIRRAASDHISSAMARTSVWGDRRRRRNAHFMVGP